MDPHSVNARAASKGQRESEAEKKPGKEEKVVHGTLRIKPKGVKVTLKVDKKVCDGCEECQVEIRGLKDEVARLKAEVLGLRTVVRRAGLR